ncbi:MAG: hypothetical protein II670_08635, partial [Alphaproteobacteria bacterium]|nr:hypothetical protein [Alphaproteobacteria bacterium]
MNNISDNYPSFYTFIPELPVQTQDAIYMWLSGKTQTSISVQLNIELHDVQRQLDDFFKHLPPHKEEKYQYWFSHYKLECDDMMKYFHVGRDVYQYLRKVSKRGAKKPSLMEFDPNITDELREIINQLKYIRVYDEIVLKDKWSIIKSILKQKHSACPCVIDDVFNEYKQFCIDNSLPDSNIDIDSYLHSFKGTAVEQPFLICTYGRYVRYYDASEYDLQDLFAQIDWGQYMDMTISARKVFDDYFDVMSDYYILSGDELHNIIKKHRNVLPECVKMQRMPHIDVGNADRYQQMETLLASVMPIAFDEFIALAHEQYGIDIGTLQTPQWIGNLGQYLHNGVFSVENTISTTPMCVQQFLEQNLNNDFYFIDDVKNLLHKQFPEFDVNTLDTPALRNAHFRIFSGYILRDSYPSATKYIEQYIEKQPNNCVDLSHFICNGMQIGVIQTVVNDLCYASKLFAYAPHKYFKRDFFTTEELQCIDDYIEKSRRFVHDNDYEFINTFFLQNQGLH